MSDGFESIQKDLSHCERRCILFKKVGISIILLCSIQGKREIFLFHFLLFAPEFCSLINGKRLVCLGWEMILPCLGDDNLPV